MNASTNTVEPLTFRQRLRVQRGLKPQQELAGLTWKPHEGTQQVQFMKADTFEVLFGGQAGPGKSECLVRDALGIDRYKLANPKRPHSISNGRYNAILFRRTFNRLEGADGLIARSKQWYGDYGGTYNEGRHVWTFPSGAKVYFGHMEHDKSKQIYQGWQFAWIGFDELTEFLLSQYMYLFTRCRVPVDSGLKCFVRAATNPGNEGHTWVKKRFITQGIVNLEAQFAMVDETDTRVSDSHPDALGRMFIPATMSDNPALDADVYRRRILLNSDPVERAQLLEGDWDIISTEGKLYPNWSYDNITAEAEYNPDLPVIWGVDDGYTQGQGRGSASYHPRVILMGQLTPNGGINIFDEYYATMELSETSLNNVLAMPYREPDMVYIDSSAAELKARIWDRGITTVSATHTVSEGIKNLRRLICDGNRVRLARTHPRCENLNYEMGAARYDPKSKRVQVGEPVPLKLDDHGPDSWRYMTWHMRVKWT